MPQIQAPATSTPATQYSTASHAVSKRARRDLKGRGTAWAYDMRTWGV